MCHYGSSYFLACDLSELRPLVGITTYHAGVPCLRTAEGSRCSGHSHGIAVRYPSVLVLTFQTLRGVARAVLNPRSRRGSCRPQRLLPELRQREARVDGVAPEAR